MLRSSHKDARPLTTRMVRSVASMPQINDRSIFSTSNSSCTNSDTFALSTPKSSTATLKPRPRRSSATQRSRSPPRPRADSVTSISMSDGSTPKRATVSATRSTNPSSPTVMREKFTAMGTAARPSRCQRATVSHARVRAKKSTSAISPMSSNAGTKDAGCTSIPRSGSR